jgi:hypothetical protein
MNAELDDLLDLFRDFVREDDERRHEVRAKIVNSFSDARSGAIEEAAALCEAKVERDAEYGGRFGGYGKFLGDKTGPECAAAIRALLKPEAPK